MRIFFRELGIYLLVLLSMAIFMHGMDLFRRIIKAFYNPEKFGHALFYAALFYLLILTVRFVIKVIKNIFFKKAEPTE